LRSLPAEMELDPSQGHGLAQPGAIEV
jgi:hypothetical protein